MTKTILTFLTFFAAISPSFAMPEAIQYPADYRSTFVEYATVDHLGHKTIRVLFANPVAIASAREGGALADGSIIVMEVHRAKLGPDGRPLEDAQGRFIRDTARPPVLGVMEKHKGWADHYPEDIRNTDWEFTGFMHDGMRRPRTDMSGCHACHKQAESTDFVFSLGHIIDR